MPPFPKSDNPIRKCEGTCGRMTRSTKFSKEKYPDTVTRVTATHCQACHRALVNEGKVEVIPREAARDARKEALAAERQAAAHRAREAIERERLNRQMRRLARPVSMGQSMVRI